MSFWISLLSAFGLGYFVRAVVGIRLSADDPPLVEDWRSFIPERKDIPDRNH
jgi:hypothetical protein